jgi:uncharacterized protein
VKSTVIIAATSSRGYAQAAAEAGFDVIALDAFIDADTRRVAKQTYQLKMQCVDQGHDRYFSVDEADFKRFFLQIKLDGVAGFLYGSLFDASPTLLAWVAARVPLIGNQPEVLKQAKDFNFFKLLDDLEIPHPEVSLESPEMPAEWLSKRFGGTGGMHIQAAANHLSSAKVEHYFQHKMGGKPISMLFVADGNTARLIGFNEQFIAPTSEQPYRFAGAVGGIKLAPNMHAAFGHAAQQLTSALHLRGINSLDAILDGESLWILELNPRLSATFHLYPNLLPAHIQGCAGDLTNFSMQQNRSKAQLIVYADDALEIAADFVWPSWVADIPAVDAANSSVKIEQNAPICTVLAETETAKTAHALVLQRATTLREMLQK